MRGVLTMEYDPRVLGDVSRYPTEIDTMTPTLKNFIREFGALGGDMEAWTYESGPPPCVTYPALHPDVGPLLVYDDGDELTVCLHDKHHSHIATCDYLQNPESERLNMVALKTAQFVDDILSERILFMVDFLGSECLGSSHIYLDSDRPKTESIHMAIGLRGGNIRTERYVWSGPFNPEVG
ncbi:MAG: hypothetical protein R3C03_12075 [Pirellulaceae bacterium]